MTKKIKTYIQSVNVHSFIAMFIFLVIAVIIVCISISASNASDQSSVDNIRPITRMSIDSAASATPEITEPVKTEAEWMPDELDVDLIAKTLYGECRGVVSTTEKAAVVWCILNRVDSKGYACGKSVEYVVTFKNQFQGYDASHPVIPELKRIAEDVLIRHHREQEGESDVGRVLPKEYIYFIGDTKRNYFTTEFLGKDYWEWSLDSPYED